MRCRLAVELRWVVIAEVDAGTRCVGGHRQPEHLPKGAVAYDIAATSGHRRDGEEALETRRGPYSSATERMPSMCRWSIIRKPLADSKQIVSPECPLSDWSSSRRACPRVPIDRDSNSVCRARRPRASIDLAGSTMPGQKSPLCGPLPPLEIDRHASYLRACRVERLWNCCS